MLADARADAPWRAAMMLAEPTPQLSHAIDCLGRFVLGDGHLDGPPVYDEVLAAARREPRGEEPLDGLVRRVLLSMLEERRTRAPAHQPLASAG